MQNVNASVSIEITRVRIFDINGTQVRDFPGIDSFPSKFKTLIGPRQTTFLFSLLIFGSSAVPSPIQVVIDWRSKGTVPVTPLIVWVMRRMPTSTTSLPSCGVSNALF